MVREKIFFDQRDEYMNGIENRVWFILASNAVRNKLGLGEGGKINSFVDISYNNDAKRIEIKFDTSKLDVLQLKTIRDALRPMESYFLKLNKDTGKDNVWYLEWADPYNSDK